MLLAQTYANFSEDKSTKVGCVAFGDDNDQKSEGWNGLPRGIEPHWSKNVRPNKYFWYEHAERNMVYNAARKGVPLKGANIAVTHFPCPDCARAIIQSGIKTIYYKEKLETEQWKEATRTSETMLHEALVETIKL